MQLPIFADVILQKYIFFLVLQLRKRVAEPHPCLQAVIIKKKNIFIISGICLCSLFAYIKGIF